MAVDMRRIAMAAVDAAFDQVEESKQKKQRRALPAKRALLIGAGLMVAGRVALGGRGRSMLDSLEQRLANFDDERDADEPEGSEDREEEEEFDEPEAYDEEEPESFEEDDDEEPEDDVEDDEEAEGTEDLEEGEEESGDKDAEPEEETADRPQRPKAGSRAKRRN